MKNLSRVVPSLLVLLALFTISDMAAAQSFRKAVFPRHSTGLCLWDRSIVSNLTPPTTIPAEIAKYNSSHGYSGSSAVTMYCDVNNITPYPMNNWEDWANVFEGNYWTSGFQDIMANYDVIVVKTGYIATQMMSYPGYSMSDYQGQWNRILAVMATRPDKFFVITTNYPAATDGHSDRDQQSNLFSTWAKNLSVPANVYVLDWFHWIASTSDGYCDPVYGSWGEGPGGDHPSNAAVAVVAPRFVQEVFDAAHAYESNFPTPVTFAGPPVVTVLSAGAVRVEWKTLSEINSYRFYVQRAGVTIDSVNAAGTSLVERKYSVTDNTATPGTWRYQIKEIDLDGSVHYSEAANVLITSVPEPIVQKTALSQNYPNPFNPSTTIHYELRHRSAVHLTVFDPLGQQVALLVEGDQEAGYHDVRFNAAQLSSGVYFYRIQTPDFVETRKLLLLR
jgi:hypothetical protein